MNETDEEWQANYDAVKAIGIANLEEGTELYKWFKLQRRLYAIEMRKRAEAIDRLPPVEKRG